MAATSAGLHIPPHLRRAPTPAARAKPKVHRDWGRIALQYAPILAVTLLAKIAVPPLGKMAWASTCRSCWR